MKTDKAGEENFVKINLWNPVKTKHFFFGVLEDIDVPAKAGNCVKGKGEIQTIIPNRFCRIWNRVQPGLLIILKFCHKN